MKKQVNKKYFVVSDIHNFFDEMKIALDKKSYDKSNPNHILIVCGDIFDRGNQTLKVYEFIRSIPKENRILIKGNHEFLYNELLNKSYPESHDFSNGTVDTFCQIANKVYAEDNEKISELLENVQSIKTNSLWKDIKSIVTNSEITKWLNSDEWINYYELDNFIFVHSFIPVNIKKGLSIFFGKNGDFSYRPDWRNVAPIEWESAVWGCPYKLYAYGLFKKEEEKGKILVCGHWHTSDFFCYLDNNTSYFNKCGPIYYSKGLIGLDGGCLYDRIHDKYIHPQNVLVIEKGKIKK